MRDPLELAVDDSCYKYSCNVGRVDVWPIEVATEANRLTKKNKRARRPSSLTSETVHGRTRHSRPKAVCLASMHGSNSSQDKGDAPCFFAAAGDSDPYKKDTPFGD